MAQDRRVTRTKNALTRALFELLAEKEFEKVTVTELTRRADVDRKTFYLHYQSVGDILEEFYAEHMSRLQGALERGPDRLGLDIPGFFRTLNAILAEDLELYQSLARGPACDFFRVRLGDALKGRVLSALGQATGWGRVELEVYAEFLAAGILAVYLGWLAGEVPGDQDTLARLTSQIILRGLGDVAGE